MAHRRSTKFFFPDKADFGSDLSIRHSGRGDEPMASKSKKQIKAEIERLTALADRLPEGERRQKLVARIADLNVEYQAED
jgi:hypothetical protein